MLLFKVMLNGPCFPAFNYYYGTCWVFTSFFLISIYLSIQMLPLLLGLTKQIFTFSSLWYHIMQSFSNHLKSFLIHTLWVLSHRNLMFWALNHQALVLLVLLSTMSKSSCYFVWLSNFQYFLAVHLHTHIVSCSDHNDINESFQRYKQRMVSKEVWK